jgi:hypothetical protein
MPRKKIAEASSSFRIRDARAIKVRNVRIGRLLTVILLPKYESLITSANGQ